MPQQPAASRPTDYQRLCQMLAPDRHHITQVLTGGERGAEVLGYRWAWKHAVRHQCFRAEWERFGRVAGVRRNHQLAQAGDVTWQQLGEQLQALLTPEDYTSARRTTFTAFYTSPVVIQAMPATLWHLGVPAEVIVIPGCPRTAWAPSSATSRSPTSASTTTGRAWPCMTSSWPSPSTR
jgi:hypothetical protein